MPSFFSIPIYAYVQTINEITSIKELYQSPNIIEYIHPRCSFLNNMVYM